MFEFNRGKPNLDDNNMILNAELGHIDENMQKVYSQVTVQQNRARKINTKKNGFIKPEEFDRRVDVKQSMSKQPERSSHKPEDQDQIHWIFDLIVNEQDSRFTVWWNNIFVLASAISTYFYCYVIVIGEDNELQRY